MPGNHHEFDIKQLDHIALDKIRSDANTKYINTPESSIPKITIDTFMDYLKHHGYKIVSVDENYKLLNETQVRNIVKEAVHTTATGMGHVLLINKLMRKLGF